MTDKIRWGILGTGNIAKQFARGLQSAPDAELVAVGSRAQESADAFGDAFSVPRRHASYEALASDDGVDVVYVSTPHPFHAENSIACLKHGKAVLCEKPFALNAAEAKQVIACAGRAGVFLMEAMWTRFLPHMAKLRELLASGAVGEPRMLTADFGFRAGVNPKGRLFSLELGGGALLDVGVYPVSLSSMIFGAPEEMATLADIGETGVDEQSAFVLRGKKGELSILWTAIRTTTQQEAVVLGTDGKIRLPSPWWKGTKLVLQRPGKPDEEMNLPYDGNGYNCEAAEVARCLREGLTESPLMTHAETVSILETMDSIRRSWKLRYPTEHLRGRPPKQEDAR